MAFNQKEIETIKWGLANGKSKQEVQMALENLRLQSVGLQVPKQEKTFLQDLGGDIKETGQGIVSSIKQRGEDFAESDTLFGKTKALTGALQDVAGETFVGAGKAVLPQAAEEAISSGVEKVAGAVAGTELAQDAIGTISRLREENPKAAEVIDALANAGLLAVDLATLGAGSRLAKQGATRGAEIATDITKQALDATSDITKQATKSTSELVSSGVKKAKDITSSVISKQEAEGLRPALSQVVAERTAKDPNFASLVKEAQKQGFGEKEINLLSSIGEADKSTIKKMYDVTVKAQSNPRQITRAADILGENATNIVKQVQAENSAFGKAVDATAKELKGQLIDATPVRTRALELLQEAGVTANANGTPNWSKSIFNKTPALKNKLMKALADLPAGEIDSFDLHQFKKSIDEFVNYGVGGEGLKGKSASILKQIRAEADNLLDSSYPAYNAANTEYKTTRDFLDQVQEVVGKNVDFSTKEGAQAFGQSFRSAFSNNKSRGKTLSLIEDLQNIAKQRGLTGAEQNLLDQALYVNILEEVFGTQATTGLAGEVTKAINKAKTTAKVVRNPIEGTLDIVASKIEKAQNITPEAKKALLGKITQ